MVDAEHNFDTDFDNERRPLLVGSPGPLRNPSLPQQGESEITVIPITDDENSEDAENPLGSISKQDENLAALFPKEFHKTVVVAIFLAASFFLNTISLVLTHQRLPPRVPLPDIILDNIPTWDFGLDVAEIIIMVAVISTMTLMLLHKFRWIVFRRVFFIMGLLYLMRSLTMYVTVLPVASYTYYCSPKFNSTTVANVLGAALKVLSGFGLSISGEHTYCGDYIYSGHTVILVTAFLIIQEYSPSRSWRWRLIHWLYWTMSVAGICLVLVARGHYTVDILLGYYVTTRVFWIYHTVASNSLLKNYAVTNFLGRIWWYRIFQWLEGNVHGRLPHHYSIPFLEKYSFNLEADPDSIPFREFRQADLQREPSVDKCTGRIGTPRHRQSFHDEEAEN